MFNNAFGSKCLLLSVLLMPVCSALASSNGLDEIESTVMSMLESETKIAAIEQMQRERKALGQVPVSAAPVFSSGVKSAPIMTPPDTEAVAKKSEQPKPKVKDAKVLGIFGLGESLTANVRIDGVTLQFRRGSRYPIGYSDNSPYTLISIKTPCVKYADNGVAQTVCIDGLTNQ